MTDSRQTPPSIVPPLTDVRAALQASLGTAYSIERELGGGGMSRVFLATENQFNRRVVVKLLAPALADGVSVERFTREIALAASLQHPNIVPLLSAGDATGVPWYSMPYVEGESLRERMAMGTVTQDGATSVLRDMARALAYAHERGIVHRDIKPENILLSGDAVVVTDFGIAKALSAARSAAADATLTQIGTSIGTPAYMAPEQAVGGEIDVRADVYAWGVVAYELLAGRHPFAGKTSPQQLIAAHVAESPAALPAAVPAAFADLVQRALAKEPGERPASGRELVERLDLAMRASGGPQVAPAVRRRRAGRWLVAGAVVVALVVVGGWFLVPAQLRTLLTRPSAQLVVNRVVVSPLANETGDPSLEALGSLASAYLTESLSQLPNLKLVDAQTAAAGSAIVGTIPRLLRRDNARALADETGAGVVVAGSYFLEEGKISFRVRILDGVNGAVRQAIPAIVGSRETPTAALTLLASRVTGALALASDRDGGAGSPPALAPSLEAWQAWQQTTRNYLQEQGDANAVLEPLRTALQHDSTWATGFSALAFYAWGVGDLVLADSALARGARVPPPVPAVHRAMEASLMAQAKGDAAEGLRAAQEGLAPQYISFLAFANARPKLTVATILATDPDRGLNLLQPALYFDRLVQSYLWLGEWSRARDAAREWQKREPRLRSLRMETDAYIAAVQGDADAVDAQLQAIAQVEQRSRLGYEEAVINATTLLRTRGGNQAAADRIVNAVLDASRSPDTSIASVSMARIDMLMSAQRWPEALRALEVWSVKLDSLRLREWPRSTFIRRVRLDTRRAVVLLHLQRVAEALAIDSALAINENARWDQGHSALARAAIAAHRGETDRAIALLQKALKGGATGFLDFRAYPSIEADLLFLPLRDDPRFKALARPDPIDG